VAVALASNPTVGGALEMVPFVLLDAAAPGAAPAYPPPYRPRSCRIGAARCPAPFTQRRRDATPFQPPVRTDWLDATPFPPPVRTDWLDATPFPPPVRTDWLDATCDVQAACSMPRAPPHSRRAPAPPPPARRRAPPLLYANCKESGR
jgi:hypothetical protein